MSKYDACTWLPRQQDVLGATFMSGHVPGVLKDRVRYALLCMRIVKQVPDALKVLCPALKASDNDHSKRVWENYLDEELRSEAGWVKHVTNAAGSQTFQRSKI